MGAFGPGTDASIRGNLVAVEQAKGEIWHISAGPMPTAPGVGLGLDEQAMQRWQKGYNIYAKGNSVWLGHRLSVALL